MSEFRKKLEKLLNTLDMESGSNTPDFILAEHLEACLLNFDKAVSAREKWYDHSATLTKIMHELGVPDENYPAPVANAYEIAEYALYNGSSTHRGGTITEEL